MVRNFKSKNQRGQWSLEAMKNAVSAVCDGGQLRTIAKQFSVPRNTLRRQVHTQRNGKEIVKHSGKSTVLCASKEQELVDVALSLEYRLFGLTMRDLRRLVFQYCEKNRIKHPLNKEAQMAGEDWARLFMKRHKNLSVRQPEGMSIGCAMGFNRAKTEPFFNLLESLLFEGSSLVIPDGNIFNVDETGVTICQKPQKVIAEKGKKCVATLTSAEKGKTVTIFCCVSGTGMFILPMMIFSRVRMKAELTDKALNGTLGVATESG